MLRIVLVFWRERSLIGLCGLVFQFGSNAFEMQRQVAPAGV
jgi:hypothetical protein